MLNSRKLQGSFLIFTLSAIAAHGCEVAMTREEAIGKWRNPLSEYQENMKTSVVNQQVFLALALPSLSKERTELTKAYNRIFDGSNDLEAIAKQFETAADALAIKEALQKKTICQKKLVEDCIQQIDTYNAASINKQKEFMQSAKTLCECHARLKYDNAKKEQGYANKMRSNVIKNGLFTTISASIFGAACWGTYLYFSKADAGNFSYVTKIAAAIGLSCMSYLPYHCVNATKESYDEKYYSGVRHNNYMAEAKTWHIMHNTASARLEALNGNTALIVQYIVDTPINQLKADLETMRDLGQTDTK